MMLAIIPIVALRICCIYCFYLSPIHVQSLESSEWILCMAFLPRVAAGVALIYTCD